MLLTCFLIQNQFIPKENKNPLNYIALNTVLSWSLRPGRTKFARDKISSLQTPFQQ